MLKKLLLTVGLVLSASVFASAQEREPIKIGLLTVDSGPFAFFQSHYTDPAKLAVETINAQGGVLGRKLELVVQSHAGTPASALIAAQKLAQQDKVLFLFGFNTGAMSAALQQRVGAWDVIFLDAHSNFDDLTAKNCNKNYFRSVSTDGMAVNALKSQMKESGAKTWQILASDFVTGHAFGERLKAAVKESGGTLMSETYVPINTPDWGSQISQLSAKPADGLAIMVVGSDAVTLAKQGKQFGLFTKYKSVVSANFTNDIVLPAQGDATVGVYTSLSYSPKMPGAKNAAFAKMFEERYKHPPSFLEGEQWQAIELMKAAIEKAGTTELEPVRKALLTLKTNTILGDVEMRSDHQLVRPVAVVQIEAGGSGTGVMALRKIEAASVVLPPPSINCE